MTAGLAENIGGRSQPRYTGPAIAHELRWRGAHVGEANYPGGLIGDCDCGQPVHAAGPYTTARLARAERMHLGIEDP